LWLEEGIPPEQARNQSVAHAVAAGGVAGVWIYQGLVPKLLAVDADEVRLLRGATGLGEQSGRVAVRLMGALEVAVGVYLAANSRKKWPFVATAVAMPVLAAGAAVGDRRGLAKAFNPISLNGAVAALAVVAVATTDDLPASGRSLRSAPDRQPDVGPLP
jgi:hypothetical protein